MRTLFQDLRYGARVLRANPAFTLVAAITLALAIGVNTTVFSWIDSFLLNPLPGSSDGSRLVAIESVEPGGEGHNISYPDYRDYRDNLKLVSGLALTFQPNLFSLGEGEHARTAWGELVTGNYFDVLGVKPLAGRLFLPNEQDDSLGAHPVAVISERLWRSYFRSDPKAIGSTVRVNRSVLTVVGVAPAEFCGITRGLVFDMWVPLTMGPQLNAFSEGMLENRRARPFQTIARLKPGVTVAKARSELVALAARLAKTYPASDEGFSATVVAEQDAHAGAQSLLRAPLKILLAMGFVVLLIACANVANLLLARSVARRKEFSIRVALGAGRGRLARQLLTESLLLAGLGAVAGIPLAMWFAQALSLLAPRMIGLPVHVRELSLNPTILGFTVLVCVAAAVVSGLSPALDAMRSDVSETLKEGGRGGSPGARSNRLRGLLVASEVALAAVALVGSGLFIESFYQAQAINPGFDARNVLVSRFYLSTSGYSDEQRRQFRQRLTAQLASAPGILDVSFADVIPLGFGRPPGSDVQVDGYVPRPGEDPSVSRTLVGPGYFHLLHMPILSGRGFTSADGAETAPVIVVNQSFARRFFAGRDPVGRRARVMGEWRTVVGVVADGKYYSLTEAHRPYFYAPITQAAAPADIVFFLRTTGDPSAAVPILRREAAAIDAGASAFDAMPLADYIEGPLFPQKVAAAFLSVLGGLSLLLAAVGLYSVMSYAVGQRTQEIGIRMAMGAQPGSVLGMVLRQGMLLTAVGLAAGIVAAFALSRVVAGMLVNVSATDPPIFAGAALFLALPALLACILPARRALKVNPIDALRCQ